MDKAKRRAVIAGNWKMNNTAAEATALINAIKAELAVKLDEGPLVIVTLNLVST